MTRRLKAKNLVLYILQRIKEEFSVNGRCGYPSTWVCLQAVSEKREREKSYANRHFRVVFRVKVYLKN